MYLLQAGHTNELSRLLSYLVRIAMEPVLIDGHQAPGWWTHHSPADQSDPDWPGGHGNLGLAHGIAGPLALLATAIAFGVTVPGQVEAIERIWAELDQWRCGTPERPWWPGLLSPAEWNNRAVQQRGPQRPSWCYGTPGLARAQQLAALVLDNPERQHEAETALASCLTDDQQLAQLSDLSMCHGWAGLVQTTRRAAVDADPDSPLAALLPSLHARFEQQLHSRKPTAGDGLLEGATGIALTRQSAGTTPFAAWDACLLLALPTPPAA